MTVFICLFTLTFFVEFLHSDVAWHPSIIYYNLLFHFRLLLRTVVCTACSLIVSFSWIVIKLLLHINKLGKSMQSIILLVCSLCCCLWIASSLIISRKTLERYFKCPFHVCTTDNIRLIHTLGTDLQLIISSIVEMSLYNEHLLQSLIPGWCIQIKYFFSPSLLLVEDAALIIKLIVPIYSICT